MAWYVGEVRLQVVACWHVLASHRYYCESSSGFGSAGFRRCVSFRFCVCRCVCAVYWVGEDTVLLGAVGAWGERCVCGSHLCAEWSGQSHVRSQPGT